LIRLPAPHPASVAGGGSSSQSGQTTLSLLDPAIRADIAHLRHLVAEALNLLGRRLEERFAQAIASAQRAWETADDLVIIDAGTGALLAETRRTLFRAGGSAHRALRAVALEGLLAFDSAYGLASVAERRLSSLIRLRVRSEDADLLPEGRPFLDLAQAFAEAAQEWA
ncbi:MAG TPA: hypothetical protein VGF45_11920, partial [Polyangia bacterium]